MRLRNTALLATVFIALTAVHADTASMSFGFWDNDGTFAGVQPVTTVPTSATPFNISNFFLGNAWGGNASLVGDAATNTYELSLDNVFDDAGMPGRSNTSQARFYATFQGVTTSAGQLTLPTFFGVPESQPGWAVTGEVFTCPAGSALFCDNYITGGGTGLGNSNFGLGQTGTQQVTLAGLAPSQPFDVTLIEAFDRNGSPIVGDVGGFTVTAINSPIPPPHAVPAPVVGTGLGAIGLAIAALWRASRRRRDLASNASFYARALMDWDAPCS
jgi:hypothetical protein